MMILCLAVRSYNVATQVQATEQYFPVALFIMLHKEVVAFESVHEILTCDHSNESYRALLSFLLILDSVFHKTK